MSVTRASPRALKMMAMDSPITIYMQAHSIWSSYHISQYEPKDIGTEHMHNILAGRICPALVAGAFGCATWRLAGHLS
jgi:hypothetical protein